MRKVSIIVPVYNAENYLELSINSVLSQSYLYWELILVNDGSTDRSASICDKYALNDYRISVYHTANHGVTAARKFGADCATGEWICFLDADDILPRNSLQTMVEKSGDCDVVVGNKHIISNKEVVEERMNECDRQLQPVEFLSGLIRNEISQYITGRMFRKTLFENGTIDIPRELIMAEDFIMNVQLGNKSHKIALIKDIVYDYHVYEKSVSHTFNTSIDYEQKFCNCLLDALKRGKYYIEVKDDFIFQKVKALKAAFMAQKGYIDLKHPFVRDVCKAAKNISLSRGWKLFLNLLPLKHASYVFFDLVNK